jgi:hypothetical protein
MAAQRAVRLPGESLRRNIIIQNQLEKVKATIRRYPGPALLAALSAGIAVGVAMTRR